MPEYHVTWTIEVTAEHPVEAARLAREAASDADTTATVYTTLALDEAMAVPRTIDLYTVDVGDACCVCGDSTIGDGWDGYCCTCYDDAHPYDPLDTGD
jgi:hypothetical protein